MEWKIPIRYIPVPVAIRNLKKAWANVIILQRACCMKFRRKKDDKQTKSIFKVTCHEHGSDLSGWKGKSYNGNY